MGEYLRRKGHKKALCISDNMICLDKERYDGFCAGFGKEQADFMLIPMQQEERKKFYKNHLEKLRQYSAVFAVSDYYAIDFIHFLTEQGIAVPDDISVVGFDDTPMCKMVSPELTSVKQDVAERARIAIEKIRPPRYNEIVKIRRRSKRWNRKNLSLKQYAIWQYR